MTRELDEDEIREALRGATFRRALDWLDGHEGTFSNDPDDRGGVTKFGISKKSYPEEDIRNLTRERAEYLYARDFWLKPGISEIPGDDLAVKVFDFAVNAGPSRAIRVLQQSLNHLGEALRIDGVLGPKTLGACEDLVAAGGEQALLATFSMFQLRRYLEIIERDSSQRKFLLGWARRAADLPPAA